MNPCDRTIRYQTKLLTNEAARNYIGRHDPKILTHLELVVNALSKKETMQQLDTEATGPIPPHPPTRLSVNASAALPTAECNKTLQNLEDTRAT